MRLWLWILLVAAELAAAEPAAISGEERRQLFGKPCSQLEAHAWQLQLFAALEKIPDGPFSRLCALYCAQVARQIVGKTIGMASVAAIDIEAGKALIESSPGRVLPIHLFADFLANVMVFPEYATSIRAFTAVEFPARRAGERDIVARRIDQLASRHLSVQFDLDAENRVDPFSAPPLIVFANVRRFRLTPDNGDNGAEPEPVTHAVLVNAYQPGKEAVNPETGVVESQRPARLEIIDPLTPNQTVVQKIVASPVPGAIGIANDPELTDYRSPLLPDNQENAFVTAITAVWRVAFTPQTSR